LSGGRLLPALPERVQRLVVTELVRPQLQKRFGPDFSDPFTRRLTCFTTDSIRLLVIGSPCRRYAS